MPRVRFFRLQFIHSLCPHARSVPGRAITFTNRLSLPSFSNQHSAHIIYSRLTFTPFLFPPHFSLYSMADTVSDAEKVRYSSYCGEWHS